MANKVVVRHFHEGNDADRTVRGPAAYATRAMVVDTDTGERVTEEYWAFCNPKDQATRRMGRHISISRLLSERPEFLGTSGAHLMDA